jgi:hypothetical protein
VLAREDSFWVRPLTLIFFAIDSAYDNQSLNGAMPGKFVIARTYYEPGPLVPPYPDGSHIAGLQAIFVTMNVGWGDYVSYNGANNHFAACSDSHIR